MLLSERACDRAAAVAIAAVTVALLATTLIAHRTPGLGVETDLLGDSIPAARALMAGHFTRDTFQFRGPGYPLLLAGATALAGGDEFRAARILNVAAACAVLVIAYLMMRAFLSPLVGLGVVLGLAANPTFARAAIEAGTDMPAAALALAATPWITRGGGAMAGAVAGALAAFATLTRTNMAFLAPAGLVTLLVARAGVRRLAAWSAGFMAPIGIWMAVHAAIVGGLPRNENFVNVAYEAYGQGMGYDRFWVETGDTFHSLADVVRYDPARFVLHIARNAATRWLDDARQLMPVWIGALALIGMVLAWPRRPGWPAMALHFALAYLILTLVFYTPRFFLYLLPFYLSGTFGLLLTTAEAPPPVPAAARVQWARLVVALGLVVGSAVAAVAATRQTLADPPDETRVAGEWLRTIGRPGDRVMARKPHVAFFAHMGYVPLPHADGFTDFLAQARASHAEYLFVSQTEAALMPQISVLADSGVSLPGLPQIQHRVLREGRSLAIYRIEPNDAAHAVPQAVFDDSLLAAIRRFAAARPGQAWPQTYLGGQLVTLERYREAIAPLGEAERLDPKNPLVARFQAVAHDELGEPELAADACRRALTVDPNGSWEWGFLGHIRLGQGRYAEARDALKRAMDGAPADPRYPIAYLQACAGDGAWPEVAAVSAQILRVTPGDATARLFGARAWLALGHPERARALADLPGPAGGPDSVRWQALADSLRSR